MDLFLQFAVDLLGWSICWSTGSSSLSPVHIESSCN